MSLPTGPRVPSRGDLWLIAAGYAVFVAVVAGITAAGWLS